MAQLNNSGFDTGTNYKFGDKMIKPNFPRSAFDDSCLVTTTIDNAGLVFPIKLLEVLPNSDYEISVNSLIRVLPQAVPLYSRQRLYTYAFYSRCSDLWSGFQTFITKGYSGNEIKTVPTLNEVNSSHLFAATNPQWSSTDKKLLPGSLGDMFGIPIGVSADALETSIYGVNAMPFMMYLRIWRDYFCNRNFYIDDRAILPDDDSRFRLNDSGLVSSFADLTDYKCCFDIAGKWSSGVTTTEPKTVVPSVGMSYTDVGSEHIFRVAPFYHDYPADYFTSALPWTQRGNTPTMDISISSITGDIVNGLRAGLQHHSTYDNEDIITNNFSSTGESWHRTLKFAPGYDISGQYSGSFSYRDINKGFNDWLTSNITAKAWVPPDADFENYRYGLAGHLELDNVSNTSSVTLESLRELAIAQTIMEKMARTDGSFAEFGLTFFGEKSKSATDYRPTFIGGSYSNLVFTEVLQTSQTTETSALGQYAGHGIGIQNKGYLGRFHADDYGYIMILGCIMPDVYYHQGLHKMWTRTDQSQWFLPERAELGMQPILNKEIYLQSYSVEDDDGNPENDNLFAYQDIFDEYRFQDNQIKGKIALIGSSDNSALTFSPYTQARHFTSLPSWSQAFAEANDVRKDYLQAPIECAYTAQFDLNIKSVKPLPYRARPASILNGLVR